VPKRKRAKPRRYSHLSDDDRIQHLLALADSKRVERLDHEFALARLRALPAKERTKSDDPQQDYASAVERVRAELAKCDAAAKVAEEQARAIAPKRKATQAETKARRERVAERRRQVIAEHVRSWETTRLAHEVEVRRLELVPEPERFDYTEREPGADRRTFSWQQAHDLHEQALDGIEQSIKIATSLLKG
jgi:hypothetical protein